MQVQRLLLFVGCALLLLLGYCSQTTEARRLIFYSPHSRTLTGQLLITHRRKRPCPKGKLRDHRDRCRRALILGRNK